MATIVVATANGLHSFDEAGPAGRVHHEGREVTTVGPSGHEMWAILDGSELWHTRDVEHWSKVGQLTAHAGTCLAAIDPDVFVGTSEARLFRVVDHTFEPVEGFDDAPGRADWYTPWGGPPDTRSIANWDEAIYVNVHVGGILRTEDRGGTWTPTIDVDADVHHVTTADGLVLAACADGLAVSRDAGATWTLRTEGLEAPYARAVAVCGEAVLVSTSRGPRGGRSGVYRGQLADGPLERCREGLPEWFDDNVDTYCLDAVPDGSFAAFGTADGRVFGSSTVGERWLEIASGLPRVNRVLVLP
jgi:hypothetical protein